MNMQNKIEELKTSLREVEEKRDYYKRMAIFDKDTGGSLYSSVNKEEVFYRDEFNILVGENKRLESEDAKNRIIIRHLINPESIIKEMESSPHQQLKQKVY